MKRIRVSKKQFLGIKIPDLISQSFFALVIKLLAVMVGFLTNVYLARTLGASGSGAYYFALTVITFCATIGALGCENIILKFVAIKVKVKGYSEIRSAVSFVFYRSAVFSLAVALIVMLALIAFKGKVDPALHLMLFKTLYIIPFFTLCILLGGVLRGFGEVVFAVAVPNAFPQILALLLMLGLVPVFNATGAAYALSISYVLVASISVYFVFKKINIRFFDAIKKNLQSAEKSKIKSSGFQLLIFNLVLQVNQWFSIVFLGFISTSEVVGTYSAAAKTAGLISVFLVAINTVVAPKVAQLFSENKKEKMEILLRRATLLVLFASLLPLSITIFFPEWIMSLFGDEFIEAYRILQIMAVGQLVNALTGPVGTVLAMTGNEKSLRNSAFVSAMSCVLMNIILVPIWGGVGAAVATATCISMMSVYAWLVVKIKTGISIYPSLR